jgi:pyruvate formate lyase activating enzyme
MTGIIFDIKHYAVHDGPGIRTTVFLKGCPLQCWWCHNPESQNAEIITVERPVTWSDGTTFVDREVFGREVSATEVLREIEKDLIFFDQSGGGVTFSGGEPLNQPDFLVELLAGCRKREIHTALDTSGFVPHEILTRIAGSVDLFLFDVKLLDDTLHKKYAGVSNALPLENLKTLASSSSNVVVRFPVIPGITDTPENIAGIISLMRETDGLNRINLLPYHTIADGKYKKLNMEIKMPDIPSMSPGQLTELQAEFESNGLIATIGG